MKAMMSMTSELKTKQEYFYSAELYMHKLENYIQYKLIEQHTLILNQPGKDKLKSNWQQTENNRQQTTW